MVSKIFWWRRRASKKSTKSLCQLVKLAQYGEDHLFPAVDDVTKKIVSYLPVRDLFELRLVSKKGQNFASSEVISRAREYSYEGNDFNGAKNFLNRLRGGVQTISEVMGDFPVKLEVPWNGEATFRKWKYMLSDEEKETLKPQLSNIFCNCRPSLNNYKSVRFAALVLGIDPNFRGQYGGPLTQPVSPLEHAVSDLDVYSVSELLKRGATITYTATICCLPRFGSYFSESQIEQSKKTMQLLLQSGLMPKRPDADALLCVAAANGDHHLLPMLIAYGANVNGNGNIFIPLLYWGNDSSEASSEGDFKTVKALVEAGANPNLTNQHGEQALHYAFGKYINPDLIDLLLKHGAEVNTRDGNGDTPLLRAVNVYRAGQSKNVETVVRLLVQAGADPCLRDPQNQQLPSTWADQNGHYAAAEFLRGVELDRARAVAAQYDY